MQVTVFIQRNGSRAILLREPRCSIDTKAEYAELMAQKKAVYSGYRQARDEMKELLTVKANVDRIMGYEEEKQTEKDHSKER